MDFRRPSRRKTAHLVDPWYRVRRGDSSQCSVSTSRMSPHPGRLRSGSSWTEGDNGAGCLLRRSGARKGLIRESSKWIDFPNTKTSIVGAEGATLERSSRGVQPCPQRLRLYRLVHLLPHYHVSGDPPSLKKPLIS
jgi:hypothetical protein